MDRARAAAPLLRRRGLAVVAGGWGTDTDAHRGGGVSAESEGRTSGVIGFDREATTPDASLAGAT
jgi:hypothetical protein